MKHISSSQLSMMSRCGEQYRRRYILKEKVPPGIALIIGSATHVSIEDNMKHKVETGELLPTEAVQESARDAVNRRWDDEGVFLDESEKKEDQDKLRGNAVDSAVSLSTLHHTELAPLIRPAHVEREWWIDIKGYDCKLTGKIDLQEDLTMNGRIRDTKTAAKSPVAGSADKNQQLTIYCLASKVLDGSIAPLAVDTLVKTKTPKVVTEYTERTEADFMPVLGRIETMLLALEKGVFLPTNPDNWWCSEKFCGFATSCRYFRRTRRPSN